MSGDLSILLVGLSNNGKTHYGSQLEVRLHRGKGILKINGAVTNREPFAQAASFISQGRLAPYTPPGVDRESIWPVIDQLGRRAQLIWPDYSGETIRQIIQERRVDERWRDRIRQSSGWIFLIRPRLILENPDVWARPSQPRKEKRQTPEITDDARLTSGMSWHEQAALVELLQILLFVKRVSVSGLIKYPPLTVGLTCWDELPPKEQAMQPIELLRQTLPLFASFAESNWEPTQLHIYGISATGKTLLPDVSDDEFQDLGAHTRGWVIDEDGTKTSDLTLPIARLLETVASP